MLKSPFPFQPMRFYKTPILLNGHQMGNLMDQGDQKAVFVQGGINGNLVGAIGHTSVIPVSGISMPHDLQMDFMLANQFKTRIYSPFRKVFLQSGIHGNKISGFIN